MIATRALIVRPSSSVSANPSSVSAKAVARCMNTKLAPNMAACSYACSASRLPLTPRANPR